MRIHRLTYPDQSGGEAIQWFTTLQELDQFRDDRGFDPAECGLKSVAFPLNQDELVSRLNTEFIHTTRMLLCH